MPRIQEFRRRQVGVSAWMDEPPLPSWEGKGKRSPLHNPLHAVPISLPEAPSQTLTRLSYTTAILPYSYTDTGWILYAHHPPLCLQKPRICSEAGEGEHLKHHRATVHCLNSQVLVSSEFDSECGFFCDPLRPPAPRLLSCRCR